MSSQSSNNLVSFSNSKDEIKDVEIPSPFENFITLIAATLEVFASASKRLENGDIKPVNITTRVRTILPEDLLSSSKSKSISKKKRIIDLTNENETISTKKRKISLTHSNFPYCKHITNKGNKCWFKIQDDNNNEFCPFHNIKAIELDVKNLEKLEKQSALKLKKNEQERKRNARDIERNIKQLEKNDKDIKRVERKFKPFCKHILTHGINKGFRCRNKASIEIYCKTHDHYHKMMQLHSTTQCTHIYSQGQNKGKQCSGNSSIEKLCQHHYRMTYPLLD